LEENKLNNNELIKVISEQTSDSQKHKIMYSPSQLAYVGDAVYELLVRSHVIQNHDINVNKMHRLSIRFVKANAQAYFVDKLEEELSEEEKKIVKRGRNAKITSSPKNAELMDYRYATGFEALFGYLYLNNEIKRLMQLFSRVVEILDEKDEKK
jgi:ribonuclease-3 family protein